MRRIIKNTLSGLGHKDIVECENGEDALEKLEEDEDIVVLIIENDMPKISGMKVVKSIRAQKDASELMIILTSANGNKDIILKSMKEGVNHFIIKPFSPQVLNEKLKKAYADFEASLDDNEENTEE